ncbi:putative transcriptional regulator [Methylobacterium sp. PvP062]|uniref:Transcriptional regulator n=1 Tax=Methylobacterium radiotolerans TaxID=31998 RepID=A0ABV2NTR3_9HYPH|nr:MULTISPECIES: MucR family transcriptional regulator [unclassified Methylobacterium]MBP2499004.1 putative transcriptional regulator [Methylobacterium sp. PvP105]MBP2505565.1 putative transcriptional regulator [Methylobacterium sp. PvP109]
MDDKMGTIEAESSDYTGLTADLVVAYVANNPVPVTELAALIANVHAAVTGLGNTSALAAPRVEKPTAAQIRKSIRPDALISFEDGKPYKTLRRHLTGLGLDPETYREKWGLPRDYPLVAVSYSQARSAMAKSIGLGQSRGKAASQRADIPEATAEKSKRVGRPRKARETAEG